MSWGAGHFGQLGHGPELTSCPEPRIIERLLPHNAGGEVVEIAAGGLHSAAIVASSSGTRNGRRGGGVGGEITVRETRTFAWGSNRKGQCGIEGGKCATVPEPTPVIVVKRGEADGGRGSRTTEPVDRNVHFEKLALGRLHTVALTAYGEGEAARVNAYRCISEPTRNDKNSHSNTFTRYQCSRGAARAWDGAATRRRRPDGAATVASSSSPATSRPCAT